MGGTVMGASLSRRGVVWKGKLRMTTEDGDRTYAQAARQRLHEIEAEQLLTKVRHYLLGCMQKATTQQERDRYRVYLEHWFGMGSEDAARDSARMEDAVGYFERRWPVPARDS